MLREEQASRNKAVKFHNNHAPLTPMSITHVVNTSNNTYDVRKELLTRETYLQEIAANWTGHQHGDDNAKKKKKKKD